MIKLQLLIIALLFLIKNISTQSSCTPTICNGADCEDFPNRIVCHCPDLLKGPFCKDTLSNTENLCLSNPCWNGGTCVGSTTAWECRCPNGFSGRNCRQALADVNSCFVSNPCKNNGFCSLANNGGTSCTCVGIWTGATCETVIPLCERTRPCINGECRDGKCNCIQDFTGEFCETYSPADQIVRVRNKGGYIARMELTYYNPTKNTDEQLTYTLVRLQARISVTGTYTFRIPYTVSLEDDQYPVYLNIKAVAGSNIVNTRITNDPTCIHVWGTTFVNRWSRVDC